MRYLQFGLIFLILLLPQRLMAQGDKSVLVFAASSLADVMEDLSQHYTQDTGEEVVFSYGASSLLARQVVAGAPADIFISANEVWARYLLENSAGKTSSIIAHNRLAVLGRSDVPNISNLAELVLRKVAVGDPSHVPAGVYARQALEAEGVWEKLETELRRTANVRLATGLAAIGAVEYAIGYASDAFAYPQLEVKLLIGQNLHDRIDYFAIRVGSSTQSADGFFKFLNSAAAAKIFVSRGFTERVVQ